MTLPLPGPPAPGRIVLEGAAGPEVLLDGRRVLYFGGTSYLALGVHPEVLSALSEALGRWGLSPGGGRTTSGTSEPHLALDAACGRLAGGRTALCLPSGYLGNTVLFEAFRGEFDEVLLDERSHSSIELAVRASGAPALRYRHADPEDLGAKAREIRARGRRPAIATDGVFPATGELAPLAACARIARESEALLIVDDAHAIGVLGAHGGGTPEHLGVPHSDVLLSASLSKALGCQGGFVAGPERLGERARGSGAFAGATPLPPAVAVAACRAIEIAARDDVLRARVRENSAFAKAGLRRLGLSFPESPMPIATFVVGGGAEDGRRLHAELRRRGLLVPFNTYPGGPEGGYFRMVVTAGHSRAQIETALDILGAAL